MRHWRSRRGWARLQRPAQQRTAYALGFLFIAVLALLWYWRSHQAAVSSRPAAGPTVVAAAPAAAPLSAAVGGPDLPAIRIAGPDAAAREAALRRLDGDPGEAAEAALLGALRDDPDPALRLLAVELLQRRALSRGDADGRIQDALGAAVSDADENVGEAAIDALAELAPGVHR